MLYEIVTYLPDNSEGKDNKSHKLRARRTQAVRVMSSFDREENQDLVKLKLMTLSRTAQ